MSRISMVVLGVVLAVSAGCGLKPADQTEAKAAKSVGGVGVVDLDMVAKRLGRDIEMSNDVQDRLTELNSKLNSLRDSLRRLYDEKKDRFGESPTEDQERELQATRERMDQQLLEQKRKSEIELANYRQALVDQFREQAKPVLRDVAAGRGLSIVIPKNNGLLLSIDPAVEITDEVATKMPSSTKAEASEASPAPARAKSKKAAAETSAR
jgi:Skp family chaperone for outer membrane proteins